MFSAEDKLYDTLLPSTIRTDYSPTDRWYSSNPPQDMIYTRDVWSDCKKLCSVPTAKHRSSPQRLWQWKAILMSEFAQLLPSLKKKKVQKPLCLVILSPGTTLKLQPSPGLPLRKNLIFTYINATVTIDLIYFWISIVLRINCMTLCCLDQWHLLTCERLLSFLVHLNQSKVPRSPQLHQFSLFWSDIFFSAIQGTDLLVLHP